MLHIQTNMNQILLECFVQDKIRKKMLCMTKIVIFTSKFHLQTQINCVSLLFYYVAGLLLVSNSISDFAISERIIGGTLASQADFPFLVKQGAQKIFLHNWFRPSYYYFLSQVALKIRANHCSGFIKQLDLIITAGHCCQVAQDAADFSIYAGSDNLYYRNQVRSAYQFVIFPEFNQSTLQNDICLVKLNESLIASKMVHTIPIEIDEVEVEVGTYCMIAGWGKIEVRTYSGC